MYKHTEFIHVMYKINKIIQLSLARLIFQLSFINVFLTISLISTKLTLKDLFQYLVGLFLLLAFSISNF